MPLRTYVKPVGILTVRLLGEQKMTDAVKIHEEIHKRYAQHLAEAMGKTKTGAIPNNMIYLTADSYATPWANVAATTNTWEMEVNFYD